MKTILFRTMALTAVLALVAFGGCSSDDDPAAPPGGGGSPAFSLPAGTYNVTFDIKDCAGGLIQDESALEIWCKAEVIDELPGDLDCSPTPVGTDSMTIDCSGTVNEGGCSFSWTATGGGKKVGDTWTLSFRLETMNEAPPGCSGIGAACVDAVISAEMVAGPPTACTYADINTFESTVSGGPMDGKVPFDIGFANHSTQPGGEQWSFFGFYSTGDILTAQATAGGFGQSYNFSVDLSPIDPKALPVTVPVTITTGGGNSATGNGNTATYNEYDYDTGFNYSSTGGDGSLTVNEISSQYIAGTMQLNVQGMSYSGPGAASQEITTRSVSGGFYVDTRTMDQDRASASLAAQLSRSMVNSLRGYVR